MVCCQHSGGGLIDKPGKNRDYYHTCYCLSGLSVAQNNISTIRTIGERVALWDKCVRKDAYGNVMAAIAYGVSVCVQTLDIFGTRTRILMKPGPSCF